MNRQRAWRLTAVLGLLLAVGLATTLILYALRQNMNLFYTPSQVAAGKVPKSHLFRFGGLVVKGSLKREAKSLKVRFILTDLQEQVPVLYEGILPDLFREGQGIVATGKLNEHGVFVAEQVLAKHDENYMPPEVKASLKQQR